MHPATAKTMTTAITSTIAPKTTNEAQDHMSQASGKKICESFLFLFFNSTNFFYRTMCTATTTTIAIITIIPTRMQEARDVLSRASGKFFVFVFFYSTKFLQDYTYDKHNDHSHHHSTQQEHKNFETICLKPLVSFFFFFTLLIFYRTTCTTTTLATRPSPTIITPP